MKTELSPYKIFWIEIKPEKGIVTKKDRKTFGELLINSLQTKAIYLPFANKEKALNYIRTFDKKLDKRYCVHLFNDEQFKLSKLINGVRTIPYTHKQMNEVYYL